MKKETWHHILRIGVSVGLIAFLLTRANLSELVLALKSANIWYLLIALMLTSSQLFISAYRWQIMLSAKEIHVPLRSLVRIYLVGGFFGRFLPTVVGGDVVRGYELARFSGKAADSAATVLMERICGFLALFIICWVSLVFSFRMLEGTNIVPIAIAMSLAFVFSLAVLFNARLMDKTLSLTRFVKRWNVEDRLKKVYDSLHSFTSSKGVLVSALVVSLVNQFVAVGSTFLISQALGLNVTFVYLLIVVPLILVITMVPISVDGVGLREGAFVLFLTQQGVSPENALLLSLLWWGLTLVIGLVGGIIYGLGRYRRSTTLDAKGA